MPQGKIWLIRHGETEWSISGQHTGRTDLPLTSEGEKRAKAIGRFLGGRSFTRVLVSPLKRAFDTCRIAGYAEVAERNDDLREWDYGIYEGRSTADVRKESPRWTIWTSDVPQGESVDEVGARARRLIEDLTPLEGDVALFGHGHMSRIFAACWAGFPPVEGRRFPLGTAALGILGFERETRVISRWNVESHIKNSSDL